MHQTWLAVCETLMLWECCFLFMSVQKMPVLGDVEFVAASQCVPASTKLQPVSAHLLAAIL